MILQRLKINCIGFVPIFPLCRTIKSMTSETATVVTRFEYVKSFERYDRCLPNCWMVVRLDGRSFTRFSDLHGFEKPNDRRSLELMTRAACCVMEEVRDVCLGFGQSDEYSFVLRKDSLFLDRQKDRIISIFNSLFSAAYVYHWNDFFGFDKLLYPPSFDCRLVVYPADQNLRDYMSWRQADCHINNLYNTVFWALVQKGKLSNREAQERLKGTVSSEKHEILFSEFSVNYNNEPAMYRKGTTLLRKLIKDEESSKLQQAIVPVYDDIIGDEFWRANFEILGLKSLQTYTPTEKTSTYHFIRKSSLIPENKESKET